MITVVTDCLVGLIFGDALSHRKKEGSIWLCRGSRPLKYLSKGSIDEMDDNIINPGEVYKKI